MMWCFTHRVGKGEGIQTFNKGDSQKGDLGAM